MISPHEHATAVEAAVREAWTTAVWGDEPPQPGDEKYEAMMYAQDRAWERSRARASLGEKGGAR